MTRQHISMLAGALLTAAPLVAAQAAAPGWKEESGPNIYDPYFWSQTSAGPSNDCNGQFSYGAPCARLGQGQAPSQTANNANSRAVQGGNGGQL